MTSWAEMFGEGGELGDSPAVDYVPSSQPEEKPAGDWAGWTIIDDPAPAPARPTYRFGGPEPPAWQVRFEITDGNDDLPVKLRDSELARCPAGGFWWVAPGLSLPATGPGWSWDRYANSSNIQLSPVFPQLGGCYPGALFAMTDGLTRALPANGVWYQIALNALVPIWGRNLGGDNRMTLTSAVPPTLEAKEGDPF